MYMAYSYIYTMFEMNNPWIQKHLEKNIHDYIKETTVQSVLLQSN